MSLVDLPAGGVADLGLVDARRILHLGIVGAAHIRAAGAGGIGLADVESVARMGTTGAGEVANRGATVKTSSPGESYIWM